MIFTGSLNAQHTLDMEVVENSGIKNNAGNYFSYPVALMFNEQGNLINSQVGKKLYVLSNYTQEDNFESHFSSPNLKALLPKLGVSIDSTSKDKKTIVYIDLLKHCPPCIKITKKFESEVVGKLDSSYKVIRIDTRMEE